MPIGFLKGLFGGSERRPTTTTTVQTSKLPEEIAPFVTQVLDEAKAQYDIAKEKGYQPYPGETIAPRVQAELDAIAGLQSLVGGQQPYLDEAETALRGIDTEFTADKAQQFMSPYQQAVIDVEKRKAQEDFQRRIMPEFEKQAVGAGGMSGLGSRAGVQASRLGEAFSQQLGDIQARGQQKAYEDAYRQFTDQATRQRAQAADLRGMGLQKFQTGLAEQGLAQQLAQDERQEVQAEYDKAFREYLEQEQYPESELAQFSSFVYGNPFLRQPDTTRTETIQTPSPSLGQNLLGLGLTGLNIYGMGGGFKPGGQFSGQGFLNKAFGYKTGGRIVHRQEGGEVPNIYSNPQASPAGGGLGSLFGSRSFLGGIIPRPRPRTNVIENIDNASGSLNSYKEAMDRDMKNLNIAARGISQSYNETFGNPLRRFMSGYSPSPDVISTPTVAEMKTGGGLGSLPVVNRRGAGSTLPGDDRGIYAPRAGTMDRTDALRYAFNLGQTTTPSRQRRNPLIQNLVDLRQIIGDPVRVDAEALTRVEREKQEALAKAAKDRRERLEKRDNSMKRFVAIQKAINAGIMDPQGINLVKGAEVLGEGLAEVEAEEQALMDALEGEEYSELKQRIMSDAALKERLLKLPKEAREALIAELAVAQKFTKTTAEIGKLNAEAITNKLTQQFKLSKEVRDTMKVVLENIELSDLKPETLDRALEAMVEYIPAGVSKSKFINAVKKAIKDESLRVSGVGGGGTGPAALARSAPTLRGGRQQAIQAVIEENKKRMKQEDD